jgi:hypothetical protein
VALVKVVEDACQSASTSAYRRPFQRTIVRLAKVAQDAREQATQERIVCALLSCETLRTDARTRRFVLCA